MSGSQEIRKPRTHTVRQRVDTTSPWTSSNSEETTPPEWWKGTQEAWCKEICHALIIKGWVAEVVPL